MHEVNWLIESVDETCRWVRQNIVTVIMVYNLVGFVEAIIGTRQKIVPNVPKSDT